MGDRETEPSGRCGHGSPDVGEVGGATDSEGWGPSPFLDLKQEETAAGGGVCSWSH